MSYYTINTSNTAFLSNNESVVYAGKNGFITQIGSIPVRCTSLSDNANFIVMQLDNLYLLVDDNFNDHILNVASNVGTGNVFIKIPIAQYSDAASQQGSSGYYSKEANVTLEVVSFNISSNTVTVVNSPISGGVISSLILSTPFQALINQPILSNNFSANCLYVTGSYKSIPHYANVTNTTSYEVQLNTSPRDITDIKVYIDDIPSTNFVWSAAEPRKLILPSTLNSTQALVLVSVYTVPSIESNDIISFSTFNNNYSVVSTSYEAVSSKYDSNLTSNAFYKIYLDKPIYSDPLNYYIINISQDLEGYVGNLTSNSFTIDYEDSYPYTYSLANSGVYYMYQKNKVKYTTAKLDEYGSIAGLSPQNYIVEATTINRYNRTSATVKGLLQVESIKLSKVSTVNITERIFIDTTGGASISATIDFPPILGRDITSYEILYRILSPDLSTVPEYTRVLVNQDQNVPEIRYTINNINRGPVSGYNSLEVIVTPLNGSTKGFPTSKVESLLGKLTNPAGLSDFNVTQQGDSIIYTWQFAQTADGYILDLDTKEVEIREYPGTINLADQQTINATWGISLVIDRIPFPNTTYTTPIAKYGDYTYLIRVRDTSNNESDKISGSTITLIRTISRIYKAYNESDPSINFATQDGIVFPNSNTYPELDFPSFSDSTYNGFVYSDSTNVDNANGSSIGFSLDLTTPGALNSTNQAFAEYTTQIRDVGKVIRGAIRIKPVISIASSITYNDEYRLIQAGVSDFHLSDNLSINTSVLVDNAFGGLGTIIGLNNANAATFSYNTYAQTLTSGGASGNVFAIRNPGQFINDTANANMFAFIASVISANSILLGEVFYANGRSTGSNSFANLCISGNAYELVDLAQFLDTAGSITYIGPTRDIIQNVYIKYATDNVFYTAAANGVPGFPGHGNTNPNTFVGASDNADLGLKRYISGDIDFRYFQIKLQYFNKEPTTSNVVLEEFTYEVDVQEKAFSTVKQVSSTSGVFIDYSFKNYIESPKISATMYGSTGGYLVSVSNVSSIGCNVAVYQSNNGLAVSGYNVSVAAIGI
jgi:hypothetical protein